MFDYDRWLEGPYTDAENDCGDDCPVCFTECEPCEGAGSVDEVSCPDCDGEGRFYDPQSNSEHRDYYYEG